MQGRRKSKEDMSRFRKKMNTDKDQYISHNKRYVAVKAAAQIADLLETEGFSVGKVLAVQERLSHILPKPPADSDDILTVLRSIGVFLDSIHRSDAKLLDWELAAENLSHVLLCQAAVLVNDPGYFANLQASYMRSDLIDASSYSIGSSATSGQVMLASVIPFYSESPDYSEKVASLYYTSQFASMMPFGIIGLRSAWVRRVIHITRGT